MDRIKRGVALALLGLLAGVLAWGLWTAAFATDYGASVGWGGSYKAVNGTIGADTLSPGDADTIGPADIGSCRTFCARASWWGDSVNVSVETSIIGDKWYPVATAASALAGYDSVGIYYSKIFVRPDTLSVDSDVWGGLVRVILYNASAAMPDSVDTLGYAGRVHTLKGVISCVN